MEGDILGPTFTTFSAERASASAGTASAQCSDPQGSKLDRKHPIVGPAGQVFNFEAHARRFPVVARLPNLACSHFA